MLRMFSGFDWEILGFFLLLMFSLVLSKIEIHVVSNNLI